ncbi:MAG: STAS domain-containing protein [Syntrophales bacterium]|jgi:anti-anti-sigma factor|nr:STAS domain-containing protein [Syntrophales bacterium]
MDVKIRKEKGAAVVSPVGRIDTVTAPEFERTLTGLIAEGETRLVLDLQGVDYISSAGLRCILAAAKLLKPKSGVLVFAALQGPVKDVISISGFASLFKICDTPEEALRQV